MITVYQAVQLPTVAGLVQWQIEPRGSGRVRLRAVVASFVLDDASQTTVALSRSGQEKLLSASGEFPGGGSQCTAVFGIGVNDVVKSIITAGADPSVAQGSLHDIWLQDACEVTFNAVTSNITVATIGCWVDYE